VVKYSTKNLSIGTTLTDSRPLSYSERSAPSALQQYYYMAQWPRSMQTLHRGVRTAAPADSDPQHLNVREPTRNE